MACRWLIPLLNHPCTSSASLVVHWYGLRSAFAFTNDVEMESKAAARGRGPKAGRLPPPTPPPPPPAPPAPLRAADVAPPFFAGRMTEQAAVGFAKMRRGLKAAGHRDLHDAQAAVREQFL